MMCCYKTVEAKCKIIGFQTKLESKIMEIEENVFRQLHRKMYCNMDQWITLTIADVRRIEDQLQMELNNVCCDDTKTITTHSLFLLQRFTTHYSSCTGLEIPKIGKFIQDTSTC